MTARAMVTIVVDVKSEVLGDSMFWRGPPQHIDQIRNIPARQTAQLVVKDGRPRTCGMWRVRAEFSDDPSDREVFEWLDRNHTLHCNVESLYAVDGYNVEITRDGSTVAGPWCAPTLREAYVKAMREWDNGKKENTPCPTE